MPEASVAALFEGSPFEDARPLSVGGMGELYVVRHRDLGRTFVAKVLKRKFAGDPFLVDRFRLEARALGHLAHPNIVSAVNVGTTADGRPYLVLEHLQGRSLSAELATRGALPVVEALAYTDQMLSALEAAHAIGVVHRDIKPSNLFLCDGGQSERVLKVLDFGVARVLPEAPADAPAPLSLPTSTGAIVGTPRFVSPEGARGQRVDARADLYSAALVLYAMLTGHGPFDHMTGRKALFSAHAFAEPEMPLPAPGTGLSPLLTAALERGMAKRPEERFQTAADFRRALSEAAAAPTPEPPTFDTTAVSLAEFMVTQGPDPGFAELLAKALPTASTIVASPASETETLALSGALGPAGDTRLDHSLGSKTEFRTALLTFVGLLLTVVATLTAAGVVGILRRLWS